MRNRTPIRLEAKIHVAIMNTTDNYAEIARKHGVSYSIVYRISNDLPDVVKYDRHIIESWDDDLTWEERQLSSKYYGGRNKHLITPINPDWKLF